MNFSQWRKTLSSLVAMGTTRNSLGTPQGERLLSASRSPHLTTACVRAPPGKIPLPSIVLVELNPGE